MKPSKGTSRERSEREKEDLARTRREARARIAIEKGLSRNEFVFQLPNWSSMSLDELYQYGEAYENVVRERARSASKESVQ